MSEEIEDGGLIGKTITYLDWDKKEKIGFVMDKILVSNKGVHSTGMFHWKKDYPFSFLTTQYLIQYKIEHGNRTEGNRGDNDYRVFATYSDKTEQINPTDVVRILGEGNLLEEPVKELTDRYE